MKRTDEEDIVPVPPRPWTIQDYELSFGVGSRGDDGTVDEPVFYINLEGAHRPTELARVRYIVEAVNNHEAFLEFIKWIVLKRDRS